MNKEGLKNCPCGGKPKVNERRMWDDYDDDYNLYEIECNKCHFDILGLQEEKQKVNKQWNEEKNNKKTCAICEDLEITESKRPNDPNDKTYIEYNCFFYPNRHRLWNYENDKDKFCRLSYKAHVEAVKAEKEE